MESRRVYSLRARDVMNSDMVVVPPLTTVQEAVERMIGCDCQVAIVDRADEDDAYGIVTFQEIAYQVIAKSQQPTRIRVAEIMVKPLIVVNPNLRLPFVAQLFANTHILHAPVIDEHRLVGIISARDLVFALASQDKD